MVLGRMHQSAPEPNQIAMTNGVISPGNLQPSIEDFAWATNRTVLSESYKGHAKDDPCNAPHDSSLSTVLIHCSRSHKRLLIIP